MCRTNADNVLSYIHIKPDDNTLVTSGFKHQSGGIEYVYSATNGKFCYNLAVFSIYIPPNQFHIHATYFLVIAAISSGRYSIAFWRMASGIPQRASAMLPTIAPSVSASAPSETARRKASSNDVL